MMVQVTGRHFDASAELQTSLEEQIKRLTRFNDHATGAHVVLDIDQSGLRTATVTINIAGRGPIAASSEGENMRRAVDGMLEKLERLLKKENERSKDHRAPPLGETISA